MKDLVMGIFALLFLYSCAKAKYDPPEPAYGKSNEQEARETREAVGLLCWANIKTNFEYPGPSDDARIKSCIAANLSK